MTPSPLIDELRAYAKQFPFQLVGEDGYPFGGYWTREHAEEDARWLARVTQGWETPIQARVVETG